MSRSVFGRSSQGRPSRPPGRSSARPTASQHFLWWSAAKSDRLTSQFLDQRIASIDKGRKLGARVLEGSGSRFPTNGSLALVGGGMTVSASFRLVALAQRVHDLREGAIRGPSTVSTGIGNRELMTAARRHRDALAGAGDKSYDDRPLRPPRQASETAGGAIAACLVHLWVRCHGEFPGMVTVLVIIPGHGRDDPPVRRHCF